MLVQLCSQPPLSIKHSSMSAEQTVYVLMNMYSHVILNLPSQTEPLIARVYPDAQEHSKDPSVFVQLY